jgi:Carboxypeptidase regulatory-like domain
MVRRSFFWLVACFALSLAPLAAAQATIRGRVTDFEGRPIAGADVYLMTAAFDRAAKAATAADGSYTITAEAGTYMALTAIKDYMTKSLEYWAWNVPAFGELEINPRFDRLEVYALNAWRPQGGYPSLQVYFRPMSFLRTKAAIAKAGGEGKLNELPLLDISPRLEAKDILVKIGGEVVDVIRVNPVKEAAGPGRDINAYLIQTTLPKTAGKGDWVVIDVTLTDAESGEKGEGRLYMAKPLQGAVAKASK